MGQIKIIYHNKIGVLPQAFVTDITYSNGNISWFNSNNSIKTQDQRYFKYFFSLFTILNLIKLTPCSSIIIDNFIKGILNVTIEDRGNESPIDRYRVVIDDKSHFNFNASN